MTSEETVTLGSVSLTMLATAGFLGYHTYGGAQETYKHSKYMEKVNKIKTTDYTNITDVHRIARALHYLNPRVEIRTIDPDELTSEERKTGVSERVIFTSASSSELNLPKGIEVYKDNIFTYNKIGEKYFIKLGNINDIDRSILLPAIEDRHIDLKAIAVPVALGSTVTAAAISINSHFNNPSYAATYDAKTYINSISDTELEELCTNLETKSLDKEIEIPERKNVKKLVK